ncbi:MAG: hypothetical protein AABX71_02480 [Nanoarchaeota archaeon]
MPDKQRELKIAGRTFKVIRTISAEEFSGFPSLEKIAREFAEKNNFSGMKIENWLERYTSGIILYFDEGRAFLRGEGSGFEEMELAFGTSPVGVSKRKYSLDGELSEQEVHLQAEITYTQIYIEQQQPYSNLTPRWIPEGEQKKEVFRHDNSELWFVRAGRKAPESL